MTYEPLRCSNGVQRGLDIYLPTGDYIHPGTVERLGCNAEDGRP